MAVLPVGPGGELDVAKHLRLEQTPPDPPAPDDQREYREQGCAAAPGLRRADARRRRLSPAASSRTARAGEPEGFARRRRGGPGSGAGSGVCRARPNPGAGSPTLWGAGIRGRASAAPRRAQIGQIGEDRFGGGTGHRAPPCGPSRRVSPPRARLRVASALAAGSTWRRTTSSGSTRPKWSRAARPRRTGSRSVASSAR